MNLMNLNLNKMLSKKEEVKIKETSNTLDTIYDEIQKAEKIAIFTHETPDGDAIGCALAVSLAIQNLGKNPYVYIPEYSRMFNFLPGAENIKNTIDENTIYDLAIAVDDADLKRLIGHEVFENAKKTISIDHHGSNNMYADINFVNPAAPACAEVLILIFNYLEIEITTRNRNMFTNRNNNRYRRISISRNNSRNI